MLLFYPMANVRTKPQKTSGTLKSYHDVGGRFQRGARPHVAQIPMMLPLPFGRWAGDCWGIRSRVHL